MELLHRFSQRQMFFAMFAVICIYNIYVLSYNSYIISIMSFKVLIPLNIVEGREEGFKFDLLITSTYFYFFHYLWIKYKNALWARKPAQVDSKPQWNRKGNDSLAERLFFKPHPWGRKRWENRGEDSYVYLSWCQPPLAASAAHGYHLGSLMLLVVRAILTEDGSCKDDWQEKLLEKVMVPCQSRGHQHLPLPCCGGSFQQLRSQI